MLQKKIFEIEKREPSDSDRVHLIAVTHRHGGRAKEPGVVLLPTSMGLGDRFRASRVGHPEAGCVYDRQSTCMR